MGLRLWSWLLLLSLLQPLYAFPLPRQTRTLHSHRNCLPACAPACREERVEKGGGCGEAAAAAAAISCVNPELEGLERELQAVVGAGQADAFLLYLLGMVLVDR